MSNFSLPVIIVAMILIIVLLIYIYYRQKGSFKNALALVTIVVLTAVFGLLLQEAYHLITDNLPPSSNTLSDNADNDTTVFNQRQLEGMRPSNIKSVGDFFYFISPLARKYVRNRGKTFSPDWFLILLSLLATLSSFGFAFAGGESSKKNTVSNIVKRVIIGLVFSLLDWYVIFYMASIILLDMDGIYGMIMAILAYWFIFFIIFAIESVIEFGLVESIF